MSNNKIDPKLMKVGDSVFWDEFNQRDNPGETYIVIDSKNQTVVGQNLKLITQKKKVRV